MTDDPEPLTSYRLSRRRDQMKQAGRFAPGLRFVPRNPALLIGAAVVGVVGMLAWRNRERIARTTGPMIEDAKARGQALIDEARTKGHALVDEAMAKTQALSEKVARRRKALPDKPVTPELH